MQNGVVGGNPHRSLDLNKFRALSLTDPFVPLIFINAKDLPEGKVFSLLHEFVHIGIGEGSLFSAKDGHVPSTVNPLETFCNKIVAEILVPESEFHRLWLNVDGDMENKINGLATFFRCSKSVIARKCLDNGYISQSDYSGLQHKARLSGQKTDKSSRGDYWATLLSRADHRFLKALEISVNEGRTLYTEAFRLTNTNLSTFETMMKKVRGDLV
jgi:Zn-dependent peptidase ImmA (M78 family)